jgi:hypothetical protein
MHEEILKGNPVGAFTDFFIDFVQDGYAWTGSGDGGAICESTGGIWRTLMVPKGFP